MSEEQKQALESFKKIQWYEAGDEEYCESGFDHIDCMHFINDHYETVKLALEQYSIICDIFDEWSIKDNDIIPTTNRERDLSNYGWNKCITQLRKALTKP